MISIIGNSGIVGSGIECYLKKKKVNILTLSKNKEFSDIKIDLCNKKYLRNRALLNSDYIIFCAGVINEQLNRKFQHKKNFFFYKFLKKFNGKVIYISSSHVYGNYDGLVTEKTQIKKKVNNIYSKTHIDFENLVLDFGGYVIRANTVYGLYKNNNIRLSLIPYSFIISAYHKNKIEIKSKINLRRNFISNIGIGRLCYLIIKKKIKNNLINIVGNNNLTLYEYALLVKKEFKKLKKNIYIKKNFTKKNHFKFRSILKNKFDNKKTLRQFINNYIHFIQNNDSKFKNYKY